MSSTTENKELSPTDTDIVMCCIDCNISKDMVLRVLEIKYPHIYNIVVNNWHKYYELYLKDNAIRGRFWGNNSVGQRSE